MTVTWRELEGDIGELAATWRTARSDRQGRRHLELADFDHLAAIGFLKVVVPEASGGLWQDVPASTRAICSVLRTLAGADPSVALVSAMHPAVIGFWLAQTTSTSPAWSDQRNAVLASAADGRRWGTITSEPGSGGDIAKTTAVAAPDAGLELSLPGATYRVTGDKHFGSGSGVNDLMITTAVPADGEGPALFVLDVRGRAWDGTDGLRLLAEWDGMGMAATQSHAMRLEDCPAVRMAWDGPLEDITTAAGPFVATLFTSVVLGVLDEAIRTAKAQLAPKADALRPYERVEWTRAEMDHWLAVQAYEGALRTIERGNQPAALHAALRAKTSVAELAESTLARLARVIGGGSYSRRSPFSVWYEDVRALGFLRPPWGLAYDSLFATSFLS